MFSVGDKVKYTPEFIHEAYDDGMDKIYAAAWRGEIITEIDIGVYEVANIDCEDEVEEVCEHILEIAED